MSKYIGSNFDDFLHEDGLIEEVSAGALKRVIAWQLAEAMKAQKISKKALAERMHTSRTAVDRALDQNDAGMTLATLASAARALGQRVEVRLVPDSDTHKTIAHRHTD
ncbi:helix-turn-helix domain-containing protein [Pseudomonas sp. 18.1.10]|uniref:helix-turn-helix domain-containing protein n=1 Tax=Pseudomonas sp. 18.1.10 TaxID=2969302 RepID=UPI00214F6837|nr:helix-turn-helix domain-containing protein [Pseudomonas sp. 18.1.10]MCR4539182.1 helix-turn-helix domain-containing protein [Pseudomonas sp. 18.1.10]